MTNNQVSSLHAGLAGLTYLPTCYNTLMDLNSPSLLSYGLSDNWLIGLQAPFQ